MGVQLAFSRHQERDRGDGSDGCRWWVQLIGSWWSPSSYGRGSFRGFMGSQEGRSDEAALTPREAPAGSGAARNRQAKEASWVNDAGSVLSR